MKKYNIHRFSIWGILVLAFVTVFFHRLSIGAVADDISRDLSLSGKALGNLTSMNFYAYALMQIPVGLMVDTIGVRKICTIGTLISAIGSILFGLSDTLILAYISRFMVGIGTSVIIVSILKIQTRWFNPKKYSTLSGLTSFFGNMGAFMATVPLTYLAVSIGWRNTFFSLGFISLIIALGIFLIVKDTPEELGYESVLKSKSNRNIKEGFFSVVKNKYTWPNFMLIGSLVGSTTAILGLWGIPYMVHVYGISKQQASGYLSFLSIGFIVGAPMVGKLSEVLKGEIKKILYTTTTLFTLVWIYIVFIFDSKPPIRHLPILFFIIGLCVITHILVFTNVKEVNDIEFSAIASSIVNVGEFVGSSLVSLGIGIILDKGWSGKIINGARIYNLKDYNKAFIIIIIMGLISIISTYSLRDSKN
ncbi:MAG: MFS transporter [Firmicutes bacterium]|nr:MFS transporter [Bacillota bacterium]